MKVLLGIVSVIVIVLAVKYCNVEFFVSSGVQCMMLSTPSHGTMICGY